MHLNQINIKVIFSYNCPYTNISSYETEITNFASMNWIHYRTFNLFFLPVCWNEMKVLHQQQTEILIDKKNNDQYANGDCSLKDLFMYDIYGAKKTTSSRTIYNSGQMVHCEINTTKNNSCFQQIQKTIFNRNNHNLGLNNIQLSVGFYELSGIYLKTKSTHYIKQGVQNEISTDGLKPYYGKLTSIMKELAHCMKFTPIPTMSKDGVFFGYKVNLALNFYFCSIEP